MSILQIARKRCNRKSEHSDLLAKLCISDPFNYVTHLLVEYASTERLLAESYAADSRLQAASARSPSPDLAATGQPCRTAQLGRSFNTCLAFQESSRGGE